MSPANTATSDILTVFPFQTSNQQGKSQTTPVNPGKLSLSFNEVNNSAPTLLFRVTYTPLHNICCVVWLPPRPQVASRILKNLLKVYTKPFLSDASEINVLNKKNLPLQKLGVFQIFYCSASVGPMFSFCSYSFAHACTFSKCAAVISRRGLHISTISCSS